MYVSCECQLEVTATVRSLVQRSPTACGVSECDREASILKCPWPTRGCDGGWGESLIKIMAKCASKFKKKMPLLPALFFVRKCL